MKNNKKISIITPSFNQGNFIEDAIQSVLNQNYDNFEHIIIDGGSTDNTIDILKKYGHLKWTSEPDEGQSDALNKGFKKAEGDIIGWLNADDYYESDCFKKIIDKFLFTKVDAVYADYRFIDKNKKEIRKLITQNPVQWMSLFYCFIPSTAFFFKKDIYNSGVKIDKNFHISMDKEFFAHIFYKGFIIKKINHIVANFRWHDNNKSLDTLKIKIIRFKEGVLVFNRYSKFKLPNNNIGLAVYYILMKTVGVYRFFCRIFNISIYKK